MTGTARQDLAKQLRFLARQKRCGEEPTCSNSGVVANKASTGGSSSSRTSPAAQHVADSVAASSVASILSIEQGASSMSAEVQENGNAENESDSDQDSEVVNIELDHTRPEATSRHAAEDKPEGNQEEKKEKGRRFSFDVGTARKALAKAKRMATKETQRQLRAHGIILPDALLPGGGGRAPKSQSDDFRPAPRSGTSTRSGPQQVIFGGLFNRSKTTKKAKKPASPPPPKGDDPPSSDGDPVAGTPLPIFPIVRGSFLVKDYVSKRPIAVVTNENTREALENLEAWKKKYLKRQHATHKVFFTKRLQRLVNKYWNGKNLAAPKSLDLARMLPTVVVADRYRGSRYATSGLVTGEDLSFAVNDILDQDVVTEMVLEDETVLQFIREEKEKQNLLFQTYQQVEDEKWKLRPQADDKFRLKNGVHAWRFGTLFDLGLPKASDYVEMSANEVGVAEQASPQSSYERLQRLKNRLRHPVQQANESEDYFYGYSTGLVTLPDVFLAARATKERQLLRTATLIPGGSGSSGVDHLQFPVASGSGGATTSYDGTASTYFATGAINNEDYYMSTLRSTSACNPVLQEVASSRSSLVQDKTIVTEVLALTTSMSHRHLYRDASEDTNHELAPAIASTDPLSYEGIFHTKLCNWLHHLLVTGWIFVPDPGDENNRPVKQWHPFLLAVQALFQTDEETRRFQGGDRQMLREPWLDDDGNLDVGMYFPPAHRRLLEQMWENLDQMVYTFNFPKLARSFVVDEETYHTVLLKTSEAASTATEDHVVVAEKNVGSLLRRYQLHVDVGQQGVEKSEKPPEAADEARTRRTLALAEQEVTDDDVCPLVLYGTSMGEMDRFKGELQETSRSCDAVAGASTLHFGGDYAAATTTTSTGGTTGSSGAAPTVDLIEPLRGAYFRNSVSLSTSGAARTAGESPARQLRRGSTALFGRHSVKKSTKFPRPVQRQSTSEGHGEEGAAGATTASPAGAADDSHSTRVVDEVQLGAVVQQDKELRDDVLAQEQNQDDLAPRKRLEISFDDAQHREAFRDRFPRSDIADLGYDWERDIVKSTRDKSLFWEKELLGASFSPDLARASRPKSMRLTRLRRTDADPDFRGNLASNNVVHQYAKTVFNEWLPAAACPSMTAFQKKLRDARKELDEVVVLDFMAHYRSILFSRRKDDCERILFGKERRHKGGASAEKKEHSGNVENRFCDFESEHLWQWSVVLYWDWNPYGTVTWEIVQMERNSVQMLCMIKKI